MQSVHETVTPLNRRELVSLSKVERAIHQHER